MMMRDGMGEGEASAAREVQSTVWEGSGLIQLPERGPGGVLVRWAARDDVKGGRVPNGRPLALLLHGAGTSSLSWTAAVKALKALEARCGREPLAVVAADVRGHGGTTLPEAPELMAKTELVEDLVQLVAALAGDATDGSPLRLFVVGHSMGGALAAWVAQRLLAGELQGRVALEGLFVMEVTEETALASIEPTRRMLTHRPASFASREEALRWITAARIPANADSARMSMDGQLRPVPSAGTDGEASEGVPTRLEWRAKLLDCVEMWQTWFQGFSEAFVALPMVNKTVVAAGTVVLEDKVMAVGQMQGKFKIVVLPWMGHFVHEEDPDRIAAELDVFLHRPQRRAPPFVAM